MKIYIEDLKVITRIMEKTLFLARSYKFFTKELKSQTEEEVKNAEKDVILSIFIIQPVQILNLKIFFLAQNMYEKSKSIVE